MEKINYGRMILGGFLGTVVIFMVGFLFQAVILAPQHEYFMEKGTVLAQPREMGVIVHILGGLVCGQVLSFCYVVARKFRSPGPTTAILTGLTVALFTAGDTTAEYAFYDLGGMIPVMTFVNNIVGAILATLTAGFIYKD